MFDNQYIALILSCNRPYYKERLQRHSATWEFLRNIGFTIVFLYADSKLDEYCLQKDGDNYNLSVPCPEIYELLSVKMELAYKYFKDKNIKGILKLDDDIRILNTERFLVDIKTNFDVYDYYGLRSCIFSYNVVSHQSGCAFNKLHRNKYTYNCFKNIFFLLKDLQIQYMSGPFYWVSNAAIQTICEKGLEYMYEDVSVGYAIKQNSNLSIQSEPEYYDVILTVDDGTEC